MELKINNEYMLNVMENIINIPSPVGYYDRVSKKMIEYIEELGLKASRDNKGSIYVEIEGEDNSKTIAVAAHLDTIGLMVKAINPDGTLKLTALGGVSFNSIEGESVIVHTRDEKEYTGVVYCNSHSVHVFENARTLERSAQNMNVRLDEKIKSREDVLALGILHGDHISINPRFEYTKSGFIKTRYIDDKGCAAAVMAMLKALTESGKKPKHKLICMFTQYEEIGYGAAYLPKEISEYIAVDIGLIGPDQSGTEYDVSISAKDATTVYDRYLTTKLINLAKENDLQYKVDTYVGYTSDASHAIRGSNNIKIAAVGPGTFATHAMERTHIESLENTSKLLLAYVLASAV